MSAIFGILRIDGAPVDRACLERMAEPLRFMGPDGSATEIDGSLGMGQHVMDLHMPGRSREGLVSAKPGITLLAADIRLDNRGELAEALGIARAELAEMSDPALLLSAYAKWNEACAERLLGDFAFALYDARRRRLFCARDHFGARPFYYHHGKDAFFFASAIPGLFATGEPSHDLDPHGIASYLLTMGSCDDLTLYREIRALESGHTLVIDGAGRATKSHYWSLDPESEIRLGSDDQYIEGFRERLEQAVRVRIPESGQVGATVSGGLDSSAVTAMAARILGNRQLIGVGLLQPGEDHWLCNDWHYAHRLADSLPNLSLLCPSTEGQFPVDGQADYLAMHGLPVQNPQQYGWDTLLKTAAGQGCRVMLTGCEGDCSVSSHGEGYLAELICRGAWRGAAHELWARRSANPDRSLASLIKSDIVKPMVPQPLWSTLSRLAGRQTWQDRRAVGAWLAHEVDLERFADTIGYHKFWHERANLRRNEHDGVICLARWRGLEEHAFEFARFGLAPLHPLMDVRLIEFYLGIPSRLKVVDGSGRQAMRRAMAGLLPDEVRLRSSKGPFEPNFLQATLNSLEEMERTLRQAAQDKDVTCYVDVQRVLDFLARQRPREPQDLLRVEYLTMVFPAYYLVNALRTKGSSPSSGSAGESGRS